MLTCPVCSIVSQPIPIFVHTYPPFDVPNLQNLPPCPPTYIQPYCTVQFSSVPRQAVQLINGYKYLGRNWFIPALKVRPKVDELRKHPTLYSSFSLVALLLSAVELLLLLLLFPPTVAASTLYATTSCNSPLTAAVPTAAASRAGTM